MPLAHSRWVGLTLLGTLACNNPAPAAPAEQAPSHTQSESQRAEVAQVGDSARASQAGQSAAGAPAATPAASAAASEGVTEKSSSREFHTEPVPEGYQRFEPPAVMLEPGASDDWAQWIGGPLDQDYDVIDIQGVQSVGGHHALVYATTIAATPGTTRLWNEEDQITSRLMGGVGGEGGANVRFPPGVVFRVKKGSYILVQTHYLNATPDAIVGRSVMDIKLAPVDPSRTVASMFSSTSVSVNLAAHAESAMDISCPIEGDLKFLQISNHMHDYGVTQRTEYVDPSGAVHVLKDDQSWNGELALNPNFTKYTVDSPALVPKGSVLRTHCTWNNTTDNPVTFPTEMCVFFGFILNGNDIYCTDGKWSESKSFGATEPASATPSGASPAGGAPPTAAMPGQAPVGGSTAAMPAAVGCTSTSDQQIMNSESFDAQSTDCATPCGLDPDVAACTAPCFEKEVGLSKACAACNATNVACGAMKCLGECLTDSASAPCRSCVMANCDPAFRQCTGT